jgi:hypothetical protein
MKKCIFCTSLLQEDSYMKRTNFWIEYYNKNFPEYDLFIMNDGKIDKEKLTEKIKTIDNGKNN